MNNRKMPVWYMLKRFLPYFGKYKLTLFLDLLCASLTAVCEIVFPLIAREISNTAIYNPAALTVRTVIGIAVFYLVLRIIDTAANYYMANMGHVMGVKIETDMRRDLFSHLQKLSFSYYSNTKVGQIMGRITSDLFDITEFAHHGPEEMFIVGFKFIASFLILANINLPLTGIIFVLIPIMLVCSLSWRGKMRDAFKRQRHQIGELNAQVEDSLLGIRVVKSFANEEVEKSKFEEGNREFHRVKKLGYRYMAAFQSTTRFFDGLMYITAVAAGGIFIIYGKINAADLMAYLLYISTLLASIRVIVNFSEQFQRGMTGIERFLEIMDTEPDIVDREGAIDVGTLKGDIELRNISFRYDDGDEKVLENISLKVDAGKSIALVGPSGGGKTTLCNLIPRFYEVTDGEILIDGININNMTMHSLRNQIGVVMQDVYMFSGRVRDNIEYGRPGASLDEIKEAAQRAGAAEFIEKLPDGYDTYVGERGVKLSGGQKQRISIARVFLKNPPILILDEATSALDNESERIVQKSLDELAKGRTVFTIAHRLTTIKNADKILVLTENGIEENGTHSELIEKKGLYYHLYNI
ncbi:MAG: ABC transporter ATP-binding protein [Clostridia bacterium]|nr:ABC transporter ATP-binding protein [Clostridia bacterium]